VETELGAHTEFIITLPRALSAWLGNYASCKRWSWGHSYWLPLLPFGNAGGERFMPEASYATLDRYYSLRYNNSGKRIWMIFLC
jgi:hypothetical protein